MCKINVALIIIHFTNILNYYLEFVMFPGVRLSLKTLQCSFRVQNLKYKLKKITQHLLMLLEYDIF